MAVTPYCDIMILAKVMICCRYQAITWIHADPRIVAYIPVKFNRKCSRYFAKHFHFMHLPDKSTRSSYVIMSAMASQITGVSMVCSAVCSVVDQSSASLVFVRGIHRWQVNSTHKGPVTRKMFPIDDFIMVTLHCCIPVRIDFIKIIA